MERRNDWHVVSFYTPDYSGVAERLRDSLVTYDIAFSIYPIADKGTWYANTEYKAELIGQALRESRRDVVFLDADAEILAYPKLFDVLDCDIAAHFFRGLELLSGTVFFKNTDMTHRVVERWIQLNKETPTTPRDLEQRRLHVAITELTPRFINLPQEYCYIFDSRLPCEATPVIIHYQHSRKTRQKGLRKWLRVN